jgi:hypothetical protein
MVLQLCRCPLLPCAWATVGKKAKSIRGTDADDLSILGCLRKHEVILEKERPCLGVCNIANTLRNPSCPGHVWA